jgi:hypothetical protein
VQVCTLLQCTLPLKRLRGHLAHASGTLRMRAPYPRRLPPCLLQTAPFDCRCITVAPVKMSGRCNAVAALRCIALGARCIVGTPPTPAVVRHARCAMRSAQPHQGCAAGFNVQARIQIVLQAHERCCFATSMYGANQAGSCAVKLLGWQSSLQRKV